MARTSTTVMTFHISAGGGMSSIKVFSSIFSPYGYCLRMLAGWLGTKPWVKKEKQTGQAGDARDERKSLEDFEGVLKFANWRIESADICRTAIRRRTQIWKILNWQRRNRFS